MILHFLGGIYHETNEETINRFLCSTSNTNGRRINISYILQQIEYSQEKNVEESVYEMSEMRDRRT